MAMDEQQRADIVVADSRDADIAAIARIYGHWVATSLASFELVPPGEAEMAARRATVLADGFPWLVAREAADGTVLGYAYAHRYRIRPAYRFSCEHSVYVAPEALGRGVGSRLLAALIERCTAMGLRHMVAVIGDSGNRASIALHRAHGFRSAGNLERIGWKFGRWVDSLYMTRELGDGSATPPPERDAADN